jgi:hypothetical protein
MPSPACPANPRARRWPLPEIDFLPSWYSRLRRKERTLSGYVLLAMMVVGYVSWCCNTSHIQLAAATQHASEVDARLNIATSNALDPVKASAQVAQLLNAAQGLAVIRGTPPLSRDLATITEMIPPGVLLTDLAIEPVPVPVPLAAGATQPSSDGLTVRLRGEAPRVADVANCQAALSRLRCVKQLRLSAARDLPGPGNVSREFEITFLLSPGGQGK